MNSKTPRIDLHMHSAFSDGTDCPAEILSNVKAAGIDIFSLTDHDESAGGSEILKIIDAETDPAFITGAEFSCRDEEGRYHILGYGYDPESEAMKELTRIFHEIRIYKVMARLEGLKEEYGFEFSDEDIKALMANRNPGKPHIGNLMVKYGFAPDRTGAIGIISGLRVKSRRIRPEEAMEYIIKGGGVPVLTHGFYGDGDQLLSEEELKERVCRLKEMGLKGLECFYSGFSPKMINFSLKLKNDLNLLATAGSDYHGTNKLVQLGDTGTMGTEEDHKRIYEELRDFLDTVAGGNI